MKLFKKWVLSTIVTTLCIFGCIILINFVVDPLQQYRKASFYKPIYKNGRYLNPGIAKTYDYNTVIIGTSMVQNFRPSYLDSVWGGVSVKLPLPASSAYEQGLILETALRTGKVERVLFGLDVFSFRGPVIRYSNDSGSLPLYLYDDEVLNDISYLLSVDTLDSYRALVGANLFGTDDRLLEHDNYGFWGHQYKFSREIVLEDWRDASFNRRARREDFDFIKLKKSFDENFQKHVQSHPEVSFEVFFPPYSILVWLDSQQKGLSEDLFRFRDYVVAATTGYDNVRVFDFQSIESIVLDLDNYKDISHYSPAINDFIVDSIDNGEFLVQAHSFPNQQKRLSSMIAAHTDSFPR